MNNTKCCWNRIFKKMANRRIYMPAHGYKWHKKAYNYYPVMHLERLTQENRRRISLLCTFCVLRVIVHYCVLAIYKLSSNEFFIFENNRYQQHITENCSKSSYLKCEYEYVECYELYEMK